MTAEYSFTRDALAAAPSGVTDGPCAVSVSGVDELAAFMNARLGEDEAEIDTRDHDSGQCDYLRGVHYEPERALLEVEAKRKRLALMTEAHAVMDRLLADKHAGDAARAMAVGRARAATVAVKYDAAVWSGHPDYRAGWSA